MATTTSSIISPVGETYFHKELLGQLKNNVVFDGFGEDVCLPLHNTNTITFKRYDLLSPASEITDGVQPPFQAASASTYSATVKWYGTGVKITDQCSLVLEDDIFNEHIGIVSEACVRKRELLILASLYETDSLFASNDASVDDVLYSFTATDWTECNVMVDAEALRSIWAHLMEDKIRPYTERVMGSDKVGSSSIPPAYPMIVPTASIKFWTGLSGFQRVDAYSNDAYTFPHELGEIEGFRIIYCDNMTYASAVGGTGDDKIYPFIILGKDAKGKESFAKVKLGGEGVKTYTYKRGTAPDYWHQFDIITGKFAHASVVTQDLGVCVLYAPIAATS